MGRRQGGKGTGLGLALIRQIVSLSKGRLGVDSEYGKGSVFWFEMPYLIQPRSGSTDMSDLTAVNTTNSTDPKRIHSLHNHSTALPELRDRPSHMAPLERIMTAEQFLVSGPPDGDSARSDLKSLSQRPTDDRTKSKLGSMRSTLSRQTSQGNREPTTNKAILRTTSPAPPPRLTTSFDGPSPRSRSPVSARLDNPNVTSSPSAATSTAGLSPDLWFESAPPGVTDVFSSPITATDQRSSSTRSNTPSISHTPAHGQASTSALPPAAHDFAAVPTPPNANIIPTTSPRPDDTAPLNVLVVDDDKLTRMMMARMLTRLGHRVETAENGQIALRKITDAFHLLEDAVPVDVVFLDK